MSNALVPFGSPDRDSAYRHGGRRASADFIAHLIATSAQSPQTRARRRATPDEAVAAYQALGQRPGAVGQVVSRSL